MPLKSVVSGFHPPRFHLNFAHPSGLALLALPFFCALALWIYWPGLAGDYILDDMMNLPPLESFSKNPSFEHALHFLGSGLSSEMGRPVSLLTFLFQYKSWPLAPVNFKLVNVIIHMLSAGLLFFLFSQLAKLSNMSSTWARFTLLAATSLWLVHPLQVSTVLYISQRMAQLAAMFTFAGILSFLYGRGLLAKAAEAGSSTKVGYLWVSVGVGLGSFLAALSKETGVLLPMFVLIIETTLLRNLTCPRHWKKWTGLFLILPIMVLSLHFVRHWESYHAEYQKRDFSMAERLLTQPRVLVDYLHQIFIPNIRQFGIHHDDFSISTSWLNPIGTAPAIGFILTALLAGWYFRKRFPILAFGILWFICGHILESTFIPLEIYFEHRNYIPMVGPIWAVCYGLARMHSQSKGKQKILLVFLTMGAVAMFTLISRAESVLWGNPFKQAATWAVERPNSPRAQSLWSAQLLEMGRVKDAEAVYDGMAEQRPGDVVPLFRKMLLACLHPEVILTSMESTLHRAMAGGTSDVGTTQVLLQQAVEWKEAKECSGVDTEVWITAIEALLKNARFASGTSTFHLLLGRLHALAGRLNPAMEHLDLSHSPHTDVDVRLFQAHLLISAGLLADARIYIDKARQANQSNWVFRGYLTRSYNERKIAIMEKNLADPALQKSQAPTGS